MRARRSAADRFLRKEEARGSNPRESTSSLTSFVQAFPRVVPFAARGFAARASRDPRESVWAAEFEGANSSGFVRGTRIMSTSARHTSRLGWRTSQASRGRTW